MILPSLIATAAGRLPYGRTFLRARITRSGACGKWLNLHAGVLTSQRPQVSRVTSGDDPSAEAHGSGHHEGVNGVTGVQPITMPEAARQPSHGVPHGDGSNTVSEYAIHCRIGRGAAVDLGQHRSWNPDRDPQACGRGQHALHPPRRTTVGSRIGHDLQCPGVQDQDWHQVAARVVLAEAAEAAAISENFSLKDENSSSSTGPSSFSSSSRKPKRRRRSSSWRTAVATKALTFSGATARRSSASSSGMLIESLVTT